MTNRRYIRLSELELLRAELSERDQAVLRDLERYHLLSGGQLKRLHFTSHLNPRAAFRAMNGAMHRLHRLGLVDHLERRVGGVRAGSVSFVWHLSAPGTRLLALIDEVDPGRGEALREPGLRTVEHTLTVAELGVRLQQEARAGRVEVIECTPEPASWRTYLNMGGGLTRLKPDLFVVTAQPGGETESVCFVEIDRATASKVTVVRKAEQYETYRRTGKEQAAEGVFPRIMWVVPDQERAERIGEYLATSRRIDASIHWAGTMAQFIDQAASGATGGVQ